MKRVSFISTFISILFLVSTVAYAADSITCWFPPGWKAKGSKARAITEALSAKSGLQIKPRIAKSYPDILRAFSKNEPSLVYVGSFVQAIIAARGLGTPLVQAINGKELYSGVMVYPKGQDAKAILKNNPAQVAFAIGASSGESSAKAATAGKASIGVANHGAAVNAVKAGKAKAAVVKNWWWAANKQKFPEMEMYEVPGVSEAKNPDNVLTASKAISAESMKKITAAAIASSDIFGAKEMAPFDKSKIEFSINLMKKGKIDPMTYSW